MTADQGFHLAVIIVVAVLLTILYYVPGSKKPNIKSIFIGGFACTAFGAITHVLSGNDVNQMLILENTGGFGRAFVIGIGIMASAILVGITKVSHAARKP